MKKILTLILAALIFILVAACNNTNNNNAAVETTEKTTTGQTENPITEATESVNGTEIALKKINGTAVVPNGFYVIREDYPITEQMCSDIGVEFDNIQMAISMLQEQTLIVPCNEPYSSSLHYYIKVKDKKYKDITLSELSDTECSLIVSTVVSSFGVDDYEIVERNGLRFFVFNNGNVLRYATIINGHMIYVYSNMLSESATEEQKTVLEKIAFSIRYC